MTGHAARLAAVAAVLLVAGRVEAVSSGPISAGCYTARGRCRVQVEPFALAIAAGRQLQSLQVRIDGHTVYDFRPDQSNPPTLSYAPTMPGLGFAAPCDANHVASVVAQDTGDASPVAVGGTAAFSCPQAVPEADASALAAIASLLLLARTPRPQSGGRPRARTVGRPSGVARRQRPLCQFLAGWESSGLAIAGLAAQPIQGLFERVSDHPLKAAAHIQERVHFLGSIAERADRDGELRSRACYRPNPHLLPTEQEQVAAYRTFALARE